MADYALPVSSHHALTILFYYTKNIIFGKTGRKKTQNLCLYLLYDH